MSEITNDTASLTEAEGDCQNGEGKEFNKCTGNEYDGQWKDHEWHGNGIMKYGNGMIHEGEWSNGLKHGKGKLTYANGEVYDGKWVNNKPEYMFPVVKASKQKKGRR
jgi:hypothetical protein